MKIADAPGKVQRPNVARNIASRHRNVALPILLAPSTGTILATFKVPPALTVVAPRRYCCRSKLASSCALFDESAVDGVIAADGRVQQRLGDSDRETAIVDDRAPL